MSEPLLIELLTEELPPRLLLRLGDSFAAGIESALKSAAFLDAASTRSDFATPRRLAVHLTGVAERQPDQTVERKGPSRSGGTGRVRTFRR